MAYIVNDIPVRSAIARELALEKKDDPDEMYSVSYPEWVEQRDLPVGEDVPTITTRRMKAQDILMNGDTLFKGYGYYANDELRYKFSYWTEVDTRFAQKLSAALKEQVEELSSVITSYLALTGIDAGSTNATVSEIIRTHVDRSGFGHTSETREHAKYGYILEIGNGRQEQMFAISFLDEELLIQAMPKSATHALAPMTKLFGRPMRDGNQAPVFGRKSTDKFTIEHLEAARAVHEATRYVAERLVAATAQERVESAYELGLTMPNHAGVLVELAALVPWGKVAKKGKLIVSIAPKGVLRSMAGLRSLIRSKLLKKARSLNFRVTEAQRLVGRHPTSRFAGPTKGFTYKGFTFRGDARSTDEIFRQGFELRTEINSIDEVNGFRGGFQGAKNALDPDGKGISTSPFFRKGGAGAKFYAKDSYAYLIDGRELEGFDLYRNNYFKQQFPQYQKQGGDAVKRARTGAAIAHPQPWEINYGANIPSRNIVGAFDKNGKYIPNPNYKPD